MVVEGAGQQRQENRKHKTSRKPRDKKKGEKGANPRAFSFSGSGRAKASQARSADREQKRLHAPVEDTTTPAAEPPPLMVLVQGPPGVGKSTLIRCLVKHFAKQNLGSVCGPVTVVAGKQRRITFVECPSDMASMMDAAKVADLVLLLVDGAFGFEMETFEFLNLLQVAGFPKVMGVLTHLDGFTDPKKLKKTKKALKQRFWTEVYDGAKLFYLSGIQHGSYLKREVLNLARFISVVKTKPLQWRLAHPYVLVDRLEDVTPPDDIRTKPKADRQVVLYGYVRGAPLRPGARVHVAGAGDFTLQELDALPDPCPLPGTTSKRRSLSERDRLLYAPMADVGGFLWDKDAVYIDIPDWKVQYSGQGKAATEGETMVAALANSATPVDEALASSSIHLFRGQAELPGGQERRRMVFESDQAEGTAASSDDEGSAGSGDEEDSGSEPEADSDDGGDDGGDDGVGGHLEDDPSSSSDGEEEASDDEDGLGGAARWKRHLGTTWGRTHHSLEEAIYGTPAAAAAGRQAAAHASTSDWDCSRAQPPSLDALAAHWRSTEAVAGLRNRFVTGDWEQAAERANAAPDPDNSDGDDSSEEVYGDFEDVEAREAGAAAQQPAVDEAEQRRQLKLAKRAEFDAKHAAGRGGGGGPVDEEPPAKAARTAGGRPAADTEPSFFDAVKAQLAAKSAMTGQALAALNPAAALAMQGYRAGSYVRMRLSGVPCELVTHHNPRRPLVMGGLGQGEDETGVMRLRFKRHRWFPKVLKTRDPLILSAGWRRWQGMPILALEDHNRRLRALKYSPEHMHCTAALWGPLLPPGTGVVAVQNLTASTVGWRVAATAVVLEQDAGLAVVKKLKLVGTPFKVHRHTAFIQGMFSSQLEASRFEGAKIRTVSGIRGTIKKAVKPGPEARRDGTVRATFEDKPLLSDMVFLRAWVAVPLPELYNPVTDLLVGSKDAAAPGAAADELAWPRMRTVAQLRRDMNTGAPVNPESVYKPIERAPRTFNPLKVPTSLQAQLPFKSKPKLEAPRKRPTLEQRRAVVHTNKQDKAAYTLVQQLNALRNARAGKRRDAQQRRHQQQAKDKAQADAKRLEAAKKVRKKRYISQQQQK